MYCGAALPSLTSGRLAVCATKYRRLRHLTRELLEERAVPVLRSRVLVNPIDEHALDVIDSTWAPAGRKASFQWREHICPVLHKSHPRRLDLALWRDGQLCGLAAARLSDAKEWLSITHIEASPFPSHPLKGNIAPLVLMGADIYAKLIQREDNKGRLPRVRIMNPATGAMDVYERSGFSEVTRANGYWYATRPDGRTP